MTIYAIHENNVDGNLIRVYFFCSEYCVRSHLHKLAIPTVPGEVAGESRDYSWGRWPGVIETDWGVHCGFCDDILVDRGGEEREEEDSQGGEGKEVWNSQLIERYT